MNILDSLTTRVLPARQRPVAAIILHTTGDTDLDKILRFYDSADGLQPHYVIEVTGSIRRIVPEEQIAYHCKIDPAEAHLYQLGWATWSRWTWKADRPLFTGSEFPGYARWRADWVTFDSPLELVTGEHPNFVTVGIELQQPADDLLTADIFTDEQYTAAAELVADVAGRQGIAISRPTILGHYDCSPMRRSTAAGSWDPGHAFRFDRVGVTWPIP